MPAKPRLLYDGGCAFCRRWVERWRTRTAGAVDYEPAEGDLSAVTLVEPGGRRLSGALAVFTALAAAPGWAWPLRAYLRVPGAAAACEALYRFIAARRRFFSRLDRALWGESAEPPSFRATGALYARALGLVYLAAFASLAAQVKGLIGAQGILPVGGILEAASRYYGGERFWRLPTLFWLGHSDGALLALCWTGAALGASLALSGLAPAPTLGALWLLYLSLVNVGQIFLGYQWDSLLLEAGLLAIFLYPPVLRPGEPSRVSLFLTRWLLLRLMVSSGAVKLLSQDPAWRDLGALSFHYWTQPLPTPAAWFAAQLPSSFHRLCVGAMYLLELGLPWLLLAPRRPRRAAGAGLAALMAVIALTGNYGYFNLLAAALCLSALDDASLPPFLRGLAPEGRPSRGPSWAALCLGGGLFLAGLAPFSAALGLPAPWPCRVLAALAEPARAVNPYGLFAVMTKTRPEILLEGSADGASWKAYEFRYKAGDPLRAPPWVAPHQPRLDWQMWFAALGTCEENPWLRGLIYRLLQGEPAVTRLLAQDPFAGGRPRFVRATLYDYRFSTSAERRAGAGWWSREAKGLYCPAAALK